MVVRRIIKPVLADLENDGQWQEDESRPFGSAGTRWFVDYTVYLIDENAGWLERVFYGSKAIQLNHLGLIVCSPAFKDKPADKHYKNLVSNALVMDTFDPKKIADFVNAKLKQIKAKNKRELRNKLEEFLYIN